MRKGVHTIRSGITSVHNPTVPRRYSLDNGDFEVNMKIESVDFFPIGNDRTGAANDDWSNTTVWFVLSTSSAGGVPTSSTVSEQEYGATFNLRPSDSAQIAWGMMGGNGPFIHCFLDPDNIIPEDLYVNAWSVSAGGSIAPVFQNVGFIIRMKQVKSSGSEALLYQIRETDVE
tara:strand:+ start:1589 stop:2107 length:519 start_codon:yes stop_codon:yes gene_type:complete